MTILPSTTAIGVGIVQSRMPWYVITLLNSLYPALMQNLSSSFRTSPGHGVG